MRAFAVLTVLLASACAGKDTVFVQQTWPADHTVVVVVTGERGVPLEPRPRVYEPGDPISIELHPGVLVRLHIATFAAGITSGDGRSIAECGVVFDGPNAELPRPTSAWSSALVDPGVSPELELGPQMGSPPFQLHFENCATRDACSDYTVTLVDAPPGIPTSHIAAVDDETAVFTGGTKNGNLQLGIIEGTTARLLAIDTRLRGGTGALAWDHSSSILGISDRGNGGRLFRLDRTGATIEATDQRRFEKVWIARDGTTIFIDFDKFARELTSTSSVPQLRPDFPVDLREVTVVRRDRMFARDGNSIYHFDGAAWALEYTLSLVESASAMAGDEDGTILVGELELVRARNDVRKTWDLLPRPFDSGLRIRAAGAIGRGRFIVSGESGAVGVWIGSRWCVLPYLVDVTLARIAVSDSQRVAWVSGDKDIASGDRTVLLRVEIP